MLIGLISTAVAVLLGTALGGVAGYYGGKVDDLLMRVTEIFQTIPSFVFAIVLVAMMSPSVESTVIAIAVVSWPGIARLVRGEFLSMRRREFVQSCVSLGMGDAPHHLPADPAQLPVADHRHRLAHGGDGDPDRVRRSPSSASAIPT